MPALPAAGHDVCGTTRSSERAGALADAGAGGLAAWQESLEGASNERAKSVLGWTPVHPTWRTGFRDP